MRTCLLSFVLILPVVCYADDPPTRAEGGDTVTAAERAEAEAEVDLAVGAVRLTLLRARTRLAKDRYNDAIDVAIKGLGAVETLPSTVDRASLIDPLEKVITDARAKREAAGAEASSKQAPRVAGDAGSKPDATIQAASKADSLGIDEGEALARIGESRALPSSVMVYPRDWQQRTARRAEYADGIMYKGEPFRDENGEIKQTIVYDIQGLLMPVPRFFDLPAMDLRITTREVGDRAALRSGSAIFSGYAHDLAQGVSLLPYFGGIGGARYMEPIDRQAQDDLMRMVREVLEAK